MDKLFFRNVQQKIREFSLHEKTRPVYDAGLLILITLVIHFLYRYWANSLNYYLFGVQIITPGFMDKITTMVFHQSQVIIQWILPIQVEGKTFVFTNGHGISINENCSGLKQFLQFFLLMLLYPGPWKHKTWFIPSGLIVVHLTNLIRIVILAVTMANWPSYWHFVHRYPARLLFYFVLFSLWVIWNEKFNKKNVPI